jgi:hypothetical protein
MTRITTPAMQPVVRWHQKMSLRRFICDEELRCFSGIGG